ncbi:Txe/YoeB family addiction module toxin [Vannielia litorea]|uniref:Txe/YoeB family addiction module toxin n=1 Tax=Vannielia litorea TaxID=1217970 RepID=UPI001BCE63F9|nr:Txe/YoeB family addiction module toxin [Vannielia litorea]MBS8228752.1 Txe/YoeB family addiction module toxin [Vannielia litorea]
MNVTFTAEAWSHHTYWQKADKKLIAKINALIKECQRHPFEGTGKPEALRGDLSGFVSRRINHAHRLVYRIHGNAIEIVSCRYHYS